LPLESLVIARDRCCKVANETKVAHNGQNFDGFHMDIGRAQFRDENDEAAAEVHYGDDNPG